jgi:hypothetical protein
MFCPHGGVVQAAPSNFRLMIAGNPALTINDTFVVAGCANVDASGNPAPCLIVQWPTPPPTVLINGIPALTQTSFGLCMAAGGLPQGPVRIAVTQPRVGV